MNSQYSTHGTHRETETKKLFFSLLLVFSSSSPARFDTWFDFIVLSATTVAAHTQIRLRTQEIVFIQSNMEFE